MKTIPITILVSHNVPETVWREILNNLGKMQQRAIRMGKGLDWKCGYRHTTGVFWVVQDGQQFCIWRDGDGLNDLQNNSVQVDATALVMSGEDLN